MIVLRETIAFSCCRDLLAGLLTPAPISQDYFKGEGEAAVGEVSDEMPDIPAITFMVHSRTAPLKVSRTSPLLSCLPGVPLLRKKTEIWMGLWSWLLLLLLFWHHQNNPFKIPTSHELTHSHLNFGCRDSRWSP